MGRLDGGTYFTCEGCGVTLADDVLADSPTLSRCVNCPAA